eukprot:jgi/Undpi1/4793/HiC_scaffold_19.g08146.m1
MLRTAGREIYRHCRRGPTLAPIGARLFSAEAGGKAPGLVELVTKDEYVNFPRKKSVFYFTAKWCPPCRRIGPFFVELSEETPEVSFAKVDIEDNESAAVMAGITSVPTFKFFKAGQEIEAITGADATLLEQTVAKLAES